MSEFDILDPATITALRALPAAEIATFATVDPIIVLGPASGEAALLNHIASPTPHPAYDNMASLRLVFENGLI